VEVLPENSKIGKKGGKILNLISFNLGTLRGKLMLIPSFLNFLDSFKAQMELYYL
jgi:hypothetical protein